jgi:hypothetical protein
MPNSRIRTTSVLTLAIIVLLFFIASLPWWISRNNAPLQPQELAATATAYIALEATFERERDIARMEATSIIIYNTPTPQDGVSKPDVSYRLARAQVDMTETLSASATATILLPRAITATPVALVDTILLLTEESATELLIGYDDSIREATVVFTESGVVISGHTVVQLPILGDQLVPFEITGTLEIRDDKLYLNVIQLTANNTDYTERDERAVVEGIINRWLLDLMFGRLARSFVLSEGNLLINISERPTPTLESPYVTETAQVIASLPTPTWTLPRALTATPNGESTDEPGVITYSDNTASQEIQQRNPDWRDLTVEFNDDGSVAITGSFPAQQVMGRTIYANITAIGHLQRVDETLQLQIDEVSVNGILLPIEDVTDRIENAINPWLAMISGEQPFGDFRIAAGLLELLIAQTTPEVTSSP